MGWLLCIFRIIDWNEFRRISDEVGAIFVADIAHVAGLIAANEYPSPIGIADVVTTTTHKLLEDLAMILVRRNMER